MNKKGYRYTLGDEELKNLFKKYVKRHVFSGHKPPQGKPVLALVGAQPAAGKTKAANALAARHPDMVVLIGDELRQYHPDYARAMRENPEIMPEVTAQASGKWIGMSVDYAREKGYNLLLEGTFRNTEMVVGNADKFANRKEGGYTVEVSALAVNADRSLLDSVARYLYSGEGRWTSVAAHDEAYEGVPETLEALEKSLSISRVVVTDRSGKDLYVNERDSNGDWARPPEAAKFLEHHRNLPFSQEEAREWINDYWSHASEMIRRNELNPVTAPTFLKLHESADRIFQQAHPGNKDALKVHQSHQALQKIVFLAGKNGADNSKLPLSPKEFFNATDARKSEFLGEFQKAKREPKRQGSTRAASLLPDQIRTRPRKQRPRDVEPEI